MRSQMSGSATAPGASRRRRLGALATALVLAAAAIALSAHPAPGRAAGPSAATPCAVGGKPAAWEHVVWIVMENKGLSQIWKSARAPYTNSLIHQCSLATNYHARTHPSLPNYIAMTAGTTAGVTDDRLPSSHRLTNASIFSQLGSGRWKVLAESMPGNCFPANAGTYAVRHNPAAYFTGIAGQCSRQDIPLGSQPDLSAPFTFIVPNLVHDTHDASVATGDLWLAGFVPKILNSAQYRAGRTAVFLTYDEDDGSAANTVATLVIAPSTTRGTTVSTYYTHYSLLRTTEEMLRLPLLANATTAASMRSRFGL